MPNLQVGEIVSKNLYNAARTRQQEAELARQADLDEMKLQQLAYDDITNDPTNPYNPIARRRLAEIIADDIAYAKANPKARLSDRRARMMMQLSPLRAQMEMAAANQSVLKGLVNDFDKEYNIYDKTGLYNQLYHNTFYDKDGQFRADLSPETAREVFEAARNNPEILMQYRNMPQVQKAVAEQFKAMQPLTETLPSGNILMDKQRMPYHRFEEGKPVLDVTEIEVEPGVKIRALNPEKVALFKNDVMDALAYDKMKALPNTLTQDEKRAIAYPEIFERYGNRELKEQVNKEWEQRHKMQREAVSDAFRNRQMKRLEKIAAKEAKQDTYDLIISAIKGDAKALDQMHEVGAGIRRLGRVKGDVGSQVVYLNPKNGKLIIRDVIKVVDPANPLRETESLDSPREVTQNTEESLNYMKQFANQLRSSVRERDFSLEDINGIDIDDALKLVTE